MVEHQVMLLKKVRQPAPQGLQIATPVVNSPRPPQHGFSGVVFTLTVLRRKYPITDNTDIAVRFGMMLRKERSRYRHRVSSSNNLLIVIPVSALVLLRVSSIESLIRFRQTRIVVINIDHDPLPKRLSLLHLPRRPPVHNQLQRHSSKPKQTRSRTIPNTETPSGIPRDPTHLRSLTAHSHRQGTPVVPAATGN